MCSSHLHLLTESSIAEGKKNGHFRMGMCCEVVSSGFLKIIKIKITKCKREQN